MSSKYYMQFVLDEGAEGDPAHYSGVVEVENIFGSFGTEELEMMLADNFSVEAADVRVIHYARLH
jgi:hypothetical protein